MTLNGNHLKGASAVIDKDFASCVLAKNLNADCLIILTAVEKVAINYGKENEQWLCDLSVEDAQKYIAEGHFAPAPCCPRFRQPWTLPNRHPDAPHSSPFLKKPKKELQDGREPISISKI